MTPAVQRARDRPGVLSGVGSDGAGTLKDARSDGGSAFPGVIHVPEGQYFSGVLPSGMTLRDYFAAQAMAALLVAGPEVKAGDQARWAYDMADAMLTERDR